MLLAGAILLVVLWALGLAVSYTFGGFLHVLLAAALVLVMVHAFRKS